MHIVITATMRKEVIDVLEAGNVGNRRVNITSRVELRCVHVSLSVDRVIQTPGGHRLEGNHKVNKRPLTASRWKRTATAMAREWIPASASATLELMKPPYDYERATVSDEHAWPSAG